MTEVIGTKAGPNHSRGDDVDRLIGDLLTFWTARGGCVGKATRSPSTKFVMAVIGPILPAAIAVRLPRAIVDFARTHMSDHKGHPLAGDTRARSARWLLHFLEHGSGDAFGAAAAGADHHGRDVLDRVTVEVEQAAVRLAGDAAY